MALKFTTHDGEEFRAIMRCHVGCHGSRGEDASFKKLAAFKVHSRVEMHGLMERAAAEGGSPRLVLYDCRRGQAEKGGKEGGDERR